jgi:hypothetical protein
MDYCINTSKYICKSLVQYCINSCNFNNDDIANSNQHNKCICDCTNATNYENLCHYNNNGKDIVVILSLLLFAGSLCLICSICRSRLATYVYKKQLLQPPAYYSLPLPSSVILQQDQTYILHESPDLPHQPPSYDNANKSTL